MKKLRKTIAMLLCLCMLVGTGVVGASAYTEDEEKEMALKGEIINNMAPLWGDGMAKYPYLGGTEQSIYTSETMNALYAALDEAALYLGPQGHEYWPYASVEELTRVYNNLETALDGLKVATSSLQELYDAVKGEENGTDGYRNRYYSERIWREFCAARQTAADVLADPDDNSVTGAYFALRTAYNTLCKSNQVAGDVTGNGIVDVADVLYLQKYLAKMVSMNSSQKVVANLNERYLCKITTADVMILQKYLAGYEEELFSYSLYDIQEYDKNILIDEGKII